MGLIDAIKRHVEENPDIRRESVRVDEWNADFYFKTLTLTERHEFSEMYLAVKEDERKEALPVCAIICTSVDENGERVFSLDDYDWLKSRPGDLVQSLFNKTNKINKFLVYDVEEEKKS